MLVNVCLLCGNDNLVGPLLPPSRQYAKAISAHNRWQILYQIQRKSIFFNGAKFTNMPHFYTGTVRALGPVSTLRLKL